METHFEDKTIINDFIRYMHIFIEKFAISKISEIIVESQYIKNIISKNTKSKIHVIPDGVQIAEIQSSKMINSRPDIFIASRLVRLKGVDILIKSISKVKKEFSQIKVFIAGEGPQKDELILLAEKLGLNENVIFLGYISEKEKFEYYKSCKIVIIPSRWDCSPIGIYEAMGAGKAVIASDNTNSEILEDGKTGLIFESENFDSLADQIILLLKDERFRNQISKSAENIAKDYDWINIAKSYFKVYEQI
jgi:glycosyltransferase involved in cell wall biosynthesis